MLSLPRAAVIVSAPRRALQRGQRGWAASFGGGRTFMCSFSFVTYPSPVRSADSALSPSTDADGGVKVSRGRRATVSPSGPPPSATAEDSSPIGHLCFARLRPHRDHRGIRCASYCTFCGLVGCIERRRLTVSRLLTPSQCLGQAIKPQKPNNEPDHWCVQAQNLFQFRKRQTAAYKFLEVKFDTPDCSRAKPRRRGLRKVGFPVSFSTPSFME